MSSSKKTNQYFFLIQLIKKVSLLEMKKKKITV
jgi:hypothetical protein